MEQTPSNGAPKGAPTKDGDKPAKAVEVVTSITLHHREHAKAEAEILPPGRHTLPADVAEQLLARGHAVHAEAADAEAKAKAKAEAGVPRVLTGDAAKAAAAKPARTK